MSWRYSYHLKGNPAAGGTWSYRTTISLGIDETIIDARKRARWAMARGGYVALKLQAVPQSQLAVKDGRVKDAHIVETYEKDPGTGAWFRIDDKGKRHRVHFDFLLGRQGGHQTSIFDII